MIGKSCWKVSISFFLHPLLNHFQRNKEWAAADWQGHIYIKLSPPRCERGTGEPGQTSTPNGPLIKTTKRDWSTSGVMFTRAEEGMKNGRRWQNRAMRGQSRAVEDKERGRERGHGQTDAHIMTPNISLYKLLLYWTVWRSKGEWRNMYYTHKGKKPTGFKYWDIWRGKVGGNVRLHTHEKLNMSKRCSFAY